MRPEVGIIGWRGMVGSVLVERMLQERDFDHCEPRFYSTSQSGAKSPAIGRDLPPVGDARDLSALARHPFLVSCQGGDYTEEIHPKLRAFGWNGCFIDAASTLRLRPDSVIVLDPVNRTIIDRARGSGIKDFIGGNCTVSLMILALHGLFREGLVEWVNAMTYQAASGAGAKNMRELVLQMAAISRVTARELENPESNILSLDRALQGALDDPAFPKQEFGAPLAASLIPWIERPVEGGQTREEWKGFVEANKILGTQAPIPIDGICVRVGTMRCHSQALTVKLRRDVALDEIAELLGRANDWVQIVPNSREATLAQLTPAAISGTLRVAVGRLHKLKMGPEYLGCFTVGDQLLWGAAEPLRRVLRILLEN